MSEEQVKHAVKPQRYNVDITKEEFASRFRWGGPHSQMDKVMFFLQSVKGRVAVSELVQFIGIKRSFNELARELVEKKIVKLEYDPKLGNILVHNDEIVRCKLCWAYDPPSNRWLYKYQMWDHLSKFHHFNGDTLLAHDGRLEDWFSVKEPHPKQKHDWGTPEFDEYGDVVLKCLRCTEHQTLRVRSDLECEDPEDRTPKFREK